MRLLTDELEKVFEEHPFGSQEGKGFDAELLAHFFNPMGNQHWLITEAEQEDGEWILFGYADFGFGPECSEWGYIPLQELQEIHLPFGMSIERDICPHKTVREQLEFDGLEYNDFFVSDTTVNTNGLLGNISACQIEDALEVISDAIYQIEDKIAPELMELLKIEGAKDILYDAYSMATELMNEKGKENKEEDFDER